MVACYAPGTGGVAQSAWCDPGSAGDGQAWWAAHGGSSSVSYVAFVHRGSAGVARNVVLSGDSFHDFNTKDSAAMHTECLFLWGFSGVTLSGNRFSRCGIFDVFVPADDQADGLTVENNVFGWPVQVLDNGGANGVELAKDWRDLVVRSQAGTTLSNWLIRYNSFAHGLSLDNSAVGQGFNNVRVVGNILGNYSTCPTGVSYDHNVGAAGGSSCGGLNVRFFPYLNYQRLDFTLGKKTRAWHYVETFRCSCKLPASNPKHAKKPKKKTKTAAKK